jgi:hypothetical protein
MSTHDGLDIWTDTATLPDDGPTNGRDAASVNTPLKTNLDRTKWLKNTNGLFYVYAAEDETAPITLESFTDHTGYTAATNAKVDVPNCKVGDKLIVDATFIASFDGTLASHYGKFRLKHTDNASGSPAVVSVTGALAWLDATTLNQAKSITLAQVLTVGTAGTTRVGIQGTVTHAGLTLQIAVACVIRVHHMRLS